MLVQLLTSLVMTMPSTPSSSVKHVAENIAAPVPSFTKIVVSGNTQVNIRTRTEANIIINPKEVKTVNYKIVKGVLYISGNSNSTTPVIVEAPTVSSITVEDKASVLSEGLLLGTNMQLILKGDGKASIRANCPINITHEENELEFIRKTGPVSIVE